MIIHIKNMFDKSCIFMVQYALKSLKIKYIRVEPGIIESLSDITKEQEIKLHILLQKYDMGIINSSVDILKEKIKYEIIQVYFYDKCIENLKFSYYLSDLLNYKYKYLSKLFSENNNTTIKGFIIIVKVEKVKELLALKKYDLFDIIELAHYSSIPHMSKQFKDITGYTLSYYRDNDIKRTIILNDM